MSNNNNAVTIRVAIERDLSLVGVVRAAIGSGSPFIGFYFTPLDDEGQDGDWNYWTSETADATASNRYYTPEELIKMLAGLNK